MYQAGPCEVIVLDRVKEDALAAARLDRMLRALGTDRVLEMDERELDDLFRERGWGQLSGRTGQFDLGQSPTIIFGTFRWLPPDERERLGTRFPALRRGVLLAEEPWTFRDHAHFRQSYGTVCQPAWEVHCAFGCLHACDYCHIPPYFVVMLNLEELAGKLREFGETIPDQKLYKFDNYTDTLTLEPEYGASEVMVSTFADWPGKYLLLYTKSDNVGHLLGLRHNGHTLISWSLSCDTVAGHIEKRTPSIANRIEAIRRCQEAGYGVRVRISPICPVKNWREEYRRMLDGLFAAASPEVMSIDVLGWMDAAQMIEALDVALFDPAYAAAIAQRARDGVKTHGKHVFPHRMRADLLRFVLEEIRRLRPGQPVSLCNETMEMWRELSPLLRATPGRYACCCGPDSVPGHPLLRM